MELILFNGLGTVVLTLLETTTRAPITPSRVDLSPLSLLRLSSREVTTPTLASKYASTSTPTDFTDASTSLATTPSTLADNELELLTWEE